MRYHYQWWIDFRETMAFTEEDGNNRLELVHLRKS